MPELLSTEYEIAETGGILTPALAIYSGIVEANIAATLRLVGNNPSRWRPHVKTAKLAYTMRLLVSRGITNFKCSTTLELLTACEAGAKDVLVAYPVTGAAVRRIREIASLFPEVNISVLVEDVSQVGQWRGSGIGLFIDVNPGMNRTGIDQEMAAEIKDLAVTINNAGAVFRGLHYYDGHLSKFDDLSEREQVAHRGYDRLMALVSFLEKCGVRVPEIITAGTPAFPCTLSYRAFDDARFTHRASAGTLVYCDHTSLSQVPAEWGYRPAALVLSTVVSHPSRGRITCDAGHKTVSADAGVPTCFVLGQPQFQPAKPSEEHLPIDVPETCEVPSIGRILYLLPRHICPTVNNFDHALIVTSGRIEGIEVVTARGREAPLLAAERRKPGGSLSS